MVTSAIAPVTAAIAAPIRSLFRQQSNLTTLLSEVTNIDAHEANRGKKPESIEKSYARAIENLKAKQLVREDSDGNLSVKVK